MSYSTWVIQTLRYQGARHLGILGVSSAHISFFENADELFQNILDIVPNLYQGPGRLLQLLQRYSNLEFKQASEVLKHSLNIILTEKIVHLYKLISVCLELFVKEPKFISQFPLDFNTKWGMYLVSKKKFQRRLCVDEFLALQFEHVYENHRHPRIEQILEQRPLYSDSIKQRCSIDRVDERKEERRLERTMAVINRHLFEKINMRSIILHCPLDKIEEEMVKYLCDKTRCFI